MKLRHTIFNSIGLAVAGIAGVMFILTLLGVVSGSYKTQRNPVSTLTGIGAELVIVLCLGGGGMSNLVSDRLKPKPTIVMITVYCLTCFLLPIGIWGIFELRAGGDQKRKIQTKGNSAAVRKSPLKNNPAPARQAAHICWISAVAGFIVAVLCGSTHINPIVFLGAVVATLGMLLSLAFGIYALMRIKELGKKGILLPALIGLIISFVFLLCIIGALIKGFSEGAAELRQKHSSTMQKGSDQTNDTSHLQ